MALGNLPVLGRPTIWMIVGQGPTALLFGHFYSRLSFLSYVSLSLKYCLKGPLNPKQPTNQPPNHCFSEKIRLDISSESSARQRIHMKNQA